MESVTEILIAGGVGMVEASCAPDGIGLGELVRIAQRRGHGEQFVVVEWSTGWWRAPNGTSALHIAVPRKKLAITDYVLSRVIGPHDAGGVTVFDALVRPMMAGLVGKLGELSKSSVAELGTVWPAVVTMLLRALEDRHSVAPDDTIARRNAVMRYIEIHLSDPALSPDTIAAALHMSRRTLYKVLTPETADGTGVAAVIRRERLVRARRILVDPAYGDRTIGQIGADVGIPSAARFSRLFRAEFGVAPRDLRTRERFAQRAIDDLCTSPARFDVSCPSSPTTA
ncbi:AraC-like DNA-binding protein [Kibdelosporangium banguiense]|uniref:AraC-like DNA-binding protein n=1 Tax=Kibdelosporangium banguiense TaxID=1365924 RepID=A0ABS4TXK7_9PSEU|nr:AraC family transcriptional regulator [Kibdelosporangium banguiense]MBP2329130.1 AraC-like DNA-binding protein [Kibdelosporangium banguiense]